MRTNDWRLWVVLFLALQGASATAAEKVIWKLGETDRSDHEFTTSANTQSNEPVVVRWGTGDEVRKWPKYHPGTGNGNFGGRAYRYTLAFTLPEPRPQGVFYLDASLLFRQPRVPAVELDINGHAGRYYFDPDPMFEVGNTDDEFNAIRSVARRKIALPASLFIAGENTLSFQAVDDLSVVTRNRNVGGPGASGFCYDSLLLTHDPDATLEEKLQVALTPTALYPKTDKGIKEECLLTVRFPRSWKGGTARVSIGRFNAEVEMTPPGEFGEIRTTVLTPDDLPAGKGKIVLAEKGQSGEGPSFDIDFGPSKKWKVFYAPSMHLDIGYTDYRPKVAEVHSRSVDDLIGVLDAHPDYRFNLDGSWITEQWLATRSAAQADKLAAHARKGRVGSNALYSSFVTDYPSYEAFVRNLYLSRQLQDRLGIPFEFANITDIPGNSWSVPSVLASAGIRYFSDAANQDRGPLMEYGRWNVRSPFWWEGPDGQRVLTWFSAHYHQMKAVCGLPPAMESGRGGLTRFLRAYELVNYAPDAVLLFGTEVENLPMEYDDAAFVERWNQAYAWPQMIVCRFAEFFQYIEKNFAATIPVVRGEAGAYWGDNAGIFAWGTARDRGNQARVIGAETLATLTAAMNPALRFPQELDRAIWHNILLFIEHTYGSHRTRGQPEHDEVVGQLTDKDDQTISAEWDIDRMMRTGMSQLADMVKTEGENLIVFNPLSWKRSGLIRFMVSRGTTLTDVATGKLVDYEVIADKDGAQTIRFWAVDMPPIGYKVYRMGRGTTRSAGPDESAKSPVVENRFYKITLDPSRAAIQSVYDKELNRELIDASGPYRLNEYVLVTGGGTETGRGAGKENTRLLIQWFWLPPAELTEHHAEKGTLTGIEKTPWGWKIRMTASAVHTPRIETEILLPDDAKRIELRNRIEVELPYAKHAAYFAFPWALSAPTFRYDIANGFVDPAKDLLEGACMDWFSMQQVVNAQDAALSVDLAVVDSPLVCLGDINRGKWPRQFTAGSSTVFSYVLNNYWSPKYGGKKSVELLNRYAITSAAKFEPAAAARFSREARYPLEIAELKASDKLPGTRGVLPPAQAGMATLSPDTLMITSLKAAEDGKGLIVRVQEAAGRECDGTLSLPLLAIASAQEANAVEVPGKSLTTDASGVHFHIRANQVLTIRLTTQNLKEFVP